MRLHSSGVPRDLSEPVIGKLTRLPHQDLQERSDYIAYGSAKDLDSFEDDWAGYAGLLSTDTASSDPAVPLPRVYAPPHLEYLCADDVVELSPSGLVSVLYRRSSPHNTILTTERCNSFCLMCSQPPKEKDDSYRVGQILRLLELIDPGTVELGLSGGEPTLLGTAFLAIIDKAKRCLPATGLHVLTNGKRFKETAFAERLAAIGHHDLMLGIPLYSDVDTLHDYVVQARGAFEETMLGFYNLGKLGVRRLAGRLPHGSTHGVE